MNKLVDMHVTRIRLADSFINNDDNILNLERRFWRFKERFWCFKKILVFQIHLSFTVLCLAVRQSLLAIEHTVV